MKKLLAVLIVLMIVFVAGCSSKPVAEATNTDGVRFKIEVDSNTVSGINYIYTDKITGYQYLVVRCIYGVAITRIDD